MKEKLWIIQFHQLIPKYDIMGLMIKTKFKLYEPSKNHAVFHTQPFERYDMRMLEYVKRIHELPGVKGSFYISTFTNCKKMFSNKGSNQVSLVVACEDIETAVLVKLSF